MDQTEVKISSFGLFNPFFYCLVMWDLFLPVKDNWDDFLFSSSTKFPSILSGARKIQQLRDNSNWFRNELRKIGCEVLGDEDSPVMPIMLYNPGKIAAFSRECLKRNVSLYVLSKEAILTLSDSPFPSCFTPFPSCFPPFPFQLFLIFLSYLQFPPLSQPFFLLSIS